MQERTREIYRSVYRAQQNRYNHNTLKVFPTNSGPQEAIDSAKLDSKFKISKRRNSKYAKSKSKVELKRELRRFYVGKGNNHILVASIFELHHFEESMSIEQADIIWVQENRKLNYIELSKNKILVNLYQFHNELTNKIQLYKNVKELSELSEKFDYNEILPKTFIVDFTKPQFVKNQINEFIQHYISHHPKGKNIKLKGGFNIKNQGKQYKIKYKQVMNTIEWNEKTIEEEEKFVWILKPSDLNRGRGIKLFSKLKTLEDEFTQDQIDMNLRMYAENMQPHTYVIQKYIQNPLLLDNRKFDIRVWVLIDLNKNLYFFKEGYLRLSGYVYSLNKQTLKSTCIHLTNNAIQKNTENYGKIDEGNQWSFSRFRQYLSQNKLNHIVEFDKKIQEIKDIIKITYEATANKINVKNRKNTFQIFGYDFLIQNNGKLWLLEVNTNPCLEQSSELLKDLIPKMLNQTLSIIRNTKISEMNLYQKLL